MTLAQVEEEARSLGLEIKDYVPQFTDAEQDEYFAAVQKEYYWEKFCSQIHIPGDKDGKMKNDLLSLTTDARYRWAFERDESHVTEYERGYLLRAYRNFLECIIIFNFQLNLVPLQRLMPYAGRDCKKQFMEVTGNQCDK